ncbi:MAG: hypothetical protein M4579_002418 [Chaenotheca gracillima]|nr:MAG: hypothetical protein M4579_002418 [Chaenotheca gracillima]
MVSPKKKPQQRRRSRLPLPPGVSEDQYETLEFPILYEGDLDESAPSTAARTGPTIKKTTKSRRNPRKNPTTTSDEDNGEPFVLKSDVPQPAKGLSEKGLESPATTNYSSTMSAQNSARSRKSSKAKASMIYPDPDQVAQISPYSIESQTADCLSSDVFNYKFRFET